MFKVGDTIRCVNNATIEYELTLNKEYTVLGTKGPSWVKVLSDTGLFVWKYQHRFELVEKSKEELPTFDGNTKDDAEKLWGYTGVDNYFPRALKALANLSQAGAKKYAWGGAHDVPNGIERYRNAEWRHRIEIGKGNDIDEDISRYATSPVTHQTSRAWNLLMALELELREQETNEND